MGDDELYIFNGSCIVGELTGQKNSECPNLTNSNHCSHYGGLYTCLDHQEKGECPREKQGHCPVCGTKLKAGIDGDPETGDTWGDVHIQTAEVLDDDTPLIDIKHERPQPIVDNEVYSIYEVNEVEYEDAKRAIRDYIASNPDKDIHISDIIDRFFFDIGITTQVFNELKDEGLVDWIYGWIT